jgi:purine nucleosidase
MNHKNAIILDCDPGEDDALAILYAIHKQHPLKALVCGFGNTSPFNTIRNGAGLLALSGRDDIPLFKGTYEPYKPHPIEETIVDAGAFVGANGLCGTPLPNADHILVQNDDMEKDSMLQALAKHIRSVAPVTYIVTGPCGTLAHILDILGDEASTIIKNIILMGGALDAPGNHGPLSPDTGKSYAEFNFYCDPAGTHRVLHSGIEVTLAAWDLTETIVMNYQEILATKTTNKSGIFVQTLMKNFLESFGNENNRDFEFNDCITFTAYEGKGTLRNEKIDIVTQGEQAGRIYRSDDGVKVRFLDIEPLERNIIRNEILKTIGIEKL